MAVAVLPNVFLALRPDAPSCERLRAVSERLEAWGLPGTWFHADDFHVTVLFLGAVERRELDLLPQAVDLVASSLRRPRLTFAGLGAVGGRTEPGRVYAALDDADGLCRDLHDDLCAATGEAVDRDFRPHITICKPHAMTPRERAALPGSRSWPQLLEAHGQADWGACEVTDLVLYQSQMERRPRYRVLASWPVGLTSA